MQAEPGLTHSKVVAAQLAKVEGGGGDGRGRGGGGGGVRVVPRVRSRVRHAFIGRTCQSKRADNVWLWGFEIVPLKVCTPTRG